MKNIVTLIFILTTFKMRLLYGCFCVALIFLIVIIGIIVLIKIKKEQYILLRNTGRFPISLTRHGFKNTSVGSKKNSIKYTGHRYDRHHVRYNPHKRSYREINE